MLMFLTLQSVKLTFPYKYPISLSLLFLSLNLLHFVIFHKVNLFVLHMCARARVFMCALVQTIGGQNIIFRSRFFPSTMWDPRMEPKLSALVANTFTSWDILLAPLHLSSWDKISYWTWTFPVGLAWLNNKAIVIFTYFPNKLSA